MPKVALVEATINYLPAIHSMQLASFRTLLSKYSDYDSNPGSESYQKVLDRFHQPETKYYAITDGSLRIGAVRVKFDPQTSTARVSPLFLQPAYRGQGFGTEVMRILEETYPQAAVWEVETILQEKKTLQLLRAPGLQGHRSAAPDPRWSDHHLLQKSHRLSPWLFKLSPLSRPKTNKV
jgi:GNAT superfamily N-acetyltransferase